MIPDKLEVKLAKDLKTEPNIGTVRSAGVSVEPLSCSTNTSFPFSFLVAFDLGRVPSCSEEGIEPLSTYPGTVTPELIGEGGTLPDPETMRLPAGGMRGANRRLCVEEVKREALLLLPSCTDSDRTLAGSTLPLGIGATRATGATSDETGISEDLLEASSLLSSSPNPRFLFQTSFSLLKVALFSRA